VLVFGSVNLAPGKARTRAWAGQQNAARPLFALSRITGLCDWRLGRRRSGSWRFSPRSAAPRLYRV